MATSDSTERRVDERRLKIDRSFGIGDLAVLGIVLGFGYLIGRDRTLRAVQEPALRALSLTPAPNATPNVQSVVSLLEQLAQLTTTDQGTGLESRFRIDLDLAMAVAAARANEAWLGVCVVDVDHFKRVNDQYGHQAGDAVLAEVGRRLGEFASGDAHVGRHGGEEFLFVLPRHDIEAVAEVAERARRAIEAEPFTLAGSESLDMTVSVGAVATYGRFCSTDIVGDADQAMFAAKDAGRNRVEVRSVVGSYRAGLGSAWPMQPTERA